MPSIPLDPPTVHLLLRRATAAVCAHTGYEGLLLPLLPPSVATLVLPSPKTGSSSKALDALSDVMGGFLQNFCKVLSVNVEQKCQAGSSGFQVTK